MVISISLGNSNTTEVAAPNGTTSKEGMDKQISSAENFHPICPTDEQFFVKSTQVDALVTPFATNCEQFERINGQTACNTVGSLIKSSPRNVRQQLFYKNIVLVLHSQSPSFIHANCGVESAHQSPETETHVVHLPHCSHRPFGSHYLYEQPQHVFQVARPFRPRDLRR